MLERAATYLGSHVVYFMVTPLLPVPEDRVAEALERALAVSQAIMKVTRKIIRNSKKAIQDSKDLLAKIP
jgi:hypothetical protein